MSNLGDTVRQAALLLAEFDRQNAEPEGIAGDNPAEWAESLAEAIRDITERGWNS